MKSKIKNYNVILAGLLLILAGLILAWKVPQKEDKYIHVGIAVYDLKDTFMESYVQSLQELIETTTIAGKKVSYEIYDAEGNSRQQEKQLQYMYAQEYDVMLVNLVEPASSASVLNSAEEADIPVILFNREVAEKDLDITKDVWYVGTDAKAAGKIQAEMLTKLWEEQQETIDKNKNGKLDYILVEGEESHYDTIRRTNGFLEAGKELPLNQQKNLSADWNRQTAFEKFAELDEIVIQNTEAVICNNDDMALGIYDYYQEHQLEPPVILGINNSQEMNEKIEAGELYGTVDNNVKDQVEWICGLMKAVVEGDTKEYKKVWYSTPYAVVNEKAYLGGKYEEKSKEKN